MLRAYAVTANLSSGSSVRVLSENCSNVLSQKRVGVLVKAARKLDIKGLGTTKLEDLDMLIRLVGEKLDEEPALDRAQASVRRFRSCLSVVDATLEAELFTRVATAWQPFASAPGHGPVGHVPFSAAERGRLRAVVESQEGKPANQLGHVHFGVPLEPGMLPDLQPQRNSAYLVPCDALSRRSIEEIAAGMARGEKRYPHMYSK